MHRRPCNRKDSMHRRPCNPFTSREALAVTTYDTFALPDKLRSDSGTPKRWIEDGQQLLALLGQAHIWRRFRAGLEQGKQMEAELHHSVPVQPHLQMFAKSGKACDWLHSPRTNFWSAMAAMVRPSRFYTQCADRKRWIASIVWSSIFGRSQTACFVARLTFARICPTLEPSPDPASDCKALNKINRHSIAVRLASRVQSYQGQASVVVRFVIVVILLFLL